MKKTVLFTALVATLATPVFADIIANSRPVGRPVRRAPVVVVPVRRAPVVVAPVVRHPTYHTGGLLAAFAAGLIIGDIINNNQVQSNDMILVYVDGRRYYQYETNFFIKMPDGNYQVVSDPR